MAGDVKIVLPIDDPNLGLCWCRSHKRGLPDQHLVHDHPHRPPVAQLRVPIPPQDLGSDVVWGTDKGVCDAAIVVSHPTQLEWFHLLTEALVIHWFHAALPVVLPLWLVVFRVVRPPESRTQPEISQLDVAVRPDEDVVWLDVSVNESHSMD